MTTPSSNAEQQFLMSKTHALSEFSAANDEDFAEYRLTHRHFYVGAVCTTAVILMGAFSAFTAIFNIVGSFRHPLLFALFIGSFCFGWAYLGMCIIVAYFREKLILTESKVFQQCLFSAKEAQLTEITSVTWSHWGLAISTDQTRLKIHLGNFTQEDQAEIIDYFRHAASEELQEEWAEFEKRNNERAVEQAKPQTWDGPALFAATFFAFAGLSVYLWTLEIGGYLLGIAAFCILLGIASTVWAFKIWRNPGVEAQIVDETSAC